MPLQNRVAPNGELHAVEPRGTMMGNRGGKFHCDDKTLGRRRWASRHWIACELHFKNLHHEAMGKGYTSLFFLDEVTALSAGHRPCFFCRRKDSKLFLGERCVDDFDRALHGERISFVGRQMLGAEIPDGTMIEHSKAFFARRCGRFLRWSFAGYTDAIQFDANTPLKVLTPPSITAILAQGFQPRWHSSAQQWD